MLLKAPVEVRYVTISC